MSIRILLLFILVHSIMLLHGQDSVHYRVILIGDAGEIGIQQKMVLADAANYIIPNKTTVLYLGNNIYSRGMGLPGSKEEETTRQILQSQFMPMRSKGAPVYFIPGNRDWDQSGPRGLGKIKQQWAYLESLHDSLLMLVPANGCPDPVEINVSDNLTIIAFDSEWWLYPFGKDNPNAECSCKTKVNVIEKMQELMYKNRYKVIMLASHHPFQTYGIHGGYFSVKDHIFPLTAANKALYIPLPVLGSLYPILRKMFANPQDVRHPLYKDMIKQIDTVFSGFPNVIHVSGHDHSLQFIKNKQIQVISGAGAKKSFVKKGKHALYANKAPGFITADLLANKSIRFSYYAYTGKKWQSTFNYVQPFINVKMHEDSLLSSNILDSVELSAHAGFEQVGHLHRSLFGENYRKEWASPTKFKTIRISEINGGFTIIGRGGGHETRSLRLKDKNGNEWVLRSVEKYPDVLLPEPLRETFAKDILTDAMSAQHPYSALIVPVIAQAVHVPHAHPIIGVVAPDKELGIYSKTFVNRVCLLEEREPLGKSDNFLKMFKELNEDNNNSFDSTTFLRARLLDMYIGDWDRHGDQWRFFVEKNSKGKRFVPVPRDRDQALYINQGFFPSIASFPWIAPFLEGFKPGIRNPATFLYFSTDLNERFLNQFSYDEWMHITREFVAAVSDSVIEASLKQLPKSAYDIRHGELFKTLKARRDNLPRAMDVYYHFLNKIGFIQTTDKNELVEVTDAPDKGMKITIHKLSKSGEPKEQLFSRIYDPSTTKEIRLFIAKGNDSIIINNKNAPIKLRIVGGDGTKKYHIIESNKKVQVYEKESNASFTGNTGRFRKHLSNDTANTAIAPSNLRNVLTPLISMGYNLDDGFILGAGLRLIKQGFRKKPYASMQQLDVAHSFSTSAFRIRYKGEWLKTFGNADFILKANVFAPINVQNFFGLGNETVFDKTGNYRIRYRTRFTFYNAEPAVRWGNKRETSISIGPSFQYYHFDSLQNRDRFIELASHSSIGTYDSAIIAKDKGHAGIAIDFESDKRNNKLLPTWGSNFNFRIHGYTGLNTYSKSFVQLISEISFYKSVNPKSTIVLADRLGGGVTVGKTAFYQCLFLGGQGNLLGYRQYRFAGLHMIYNNFEVRVKLADLGSYILPGQFGLIGLYDIGRVWENNDHSSVWHSGYGGGFYFAPAEMLVIRALAGNSDEGFYPYISMGLRF